MSNSPSQSSTNILLNSASVNVPVPVPVDSGSGLDSRKRQTMMDSSFDDDRDAKDMLKEVLLKLNMLTSDISEIKQTVKRVSDKVDSHDKILGDMRSDLDKNSNDMFEVKAKIEVNAQDVERNKKSVSSIDSQLENIDGKMKELEWQSIDNEARSRRHNVIVWGQEETETENCKADCKHCKDVVDKVVSEKLKIGRKLPIQRVHRFPTSRGTTYVGRKAKPRGIMVCFRDFSDKQEVLKAAKQEKVNISEDLPKPIRDARSSLMDDVRAARSSNPPRKAAIGFPAKLFIDGKFVKEVDVVEHARKNVRKV